MSVTGPAQSSSSAAPGAQAVDNLNPVNRPRAAQIERGGAAVTLEVSEPDAIRTEANVCVEAAGAKTCV